MSLAVVGVPVLSWSTTPLPDAPMTLFQLAPGTTPGRSVGASRYPPAVKLMPNIPGVLLTAAGCRTSTSILPLLSAKQLALAMSLICRYSRPAAGLVPLYCAAHEEYLVADLTDQRGETGRIERRLWERHPRKPIGTGKVRRIAAVGPSAVRADGQRFACFQVHPGIHPRFLGIHRYRSDGL